MMKSISNLYKEGCQISFIVVDRNNKKQWKWRVATVLRSYL